MKNKDMEKGNEIKIANPALRFPEFQDTEGWNECNMDKLFDFKQGFQCPIELQYEKQEYGMVRFIRIIDITQPSTPYRFINDPGNQYHVNKEDLFMVRYGDPGLIGFGHKGVIANNLFQLIPKTKLKPHFFYYLFSKEKQRINGLSSSTSLSAINFASLNTFKINVPPNTDEQQKIADCLSSLDKLIEATVQKVETLKEHKKGLMQRLFPAEGKNVPDLRFPEFFINTTWDIVSFAKYIKLFRGSSPRPIKEYLTDAADGINWIKIGDTQYAKGFVLSEVQEKITKRGAEKSRYVHKGELVLANSMSFGKTYLLAIDGCIYDGWFVLRGYEEAYYKPFLLQVLNSDYVQNQYKRLSAGGIVLNISSEIVYQTHIFHTSIQEQKKIADCLSSLDELIETTSRKVEILKAHKKGLMQQLFPKI